MSKSAIKDTIREGGRSLNRFVSILLIIMIGVAFFVGIKSTAPSMKHTADLYYNQCNMSDLRIVSTLGLVQEDIDKIAALPQVEAVQPGYFVDTLAFTGSAEFVFRAHSMPKPISETEQAENTINKVVLAEGRLPVNPGECVIETPNDTMNHGYKIGDYISVSSGTATPITDTLSAESFEIVGLVQTPFYMAIDKGTCEIGSGTVQFFMYLLEDDFVSYTSENQYFIEANIKIKDATKYSTYSEDYEKLIADACAPLENLGIERSEIRLQNIKDMAYAEIAKEEAKLAQEEAKYNIEMSNAWAKLEAGLTQIRQGETELTLSSDYYNEKIKEGEKQIADAEQQIAEGKLQIAEGERQLEDARRQYDQIMYENSGLLADYDNILAQLNDATTRFDNMKRDLEATVNDPNADPVSKGIAQYTLSNIESTEEWQVVQDLKGKYNDIKDARKAIDVMIDKINDEITNAEKTIMDSKRQLAQGEAEYQAGLSYIAEQKRLFADTIEDAEIQLSKGQNEYDLGLVEYNTNKAEYDKLFADGKLQIYDAKAQIDQLETPSWLALDRNMIYSYVSYESTADQMDAIAQLFPVFFFLVAVLVCLTTMTRMVDDQRGVMGAYKALGYSDASIFAKYAMYGASASLIGSVVGAILGIKLIPQVIFNSYRMMYTMPELTNKSEIGIVLAAVLLGISVTVLAAFFVCRKELRSCAAQLLRPKAPKAGKPIFLEKITFLWKSFSFSTKVTCRNIFRYKKKFFMTIFGIMGCTALMLAGFGLSDSISNIVPNQFGSIFAYNVSVTVNSEATSSELNAMYDYLEPANNPNVESYTTVYSLNSSFEADGTSIANITLMTVPYEVNDSFDNYITLRDRVSQKPIAVPEEGVIIGEKLADELGIGIGDYVKVSYTNDTSALSAVGLSGTYITRTLKVADITENYIYHYAYMSENYFEKQFGTEIEYNSVLIKLYETSAELEKQIGADLKETGGARSAMYFTNASESFEETVETLNSVVLLIIAFAGLLAFVVLYNLTNINIVERIREIATIKVLGFYNMESYMYVFRENIILSIIGALIGLFVGIFLHMFIMDAIAMDGIMFGNYIAPVSYLYAFLLTIVFSMVVNIAMTKRIKNIPMVESLKSVE